MCQNILNVICIRVKMLGGDTSDKNALEYLVKKSLQQAKDFCNVVHEFPVEAETYLVEWAAADYLTETRGYSKQWERMRKDAETGLVNFRCMRW